MATDGGFIRFSLEAKYHDRADSSAEPVPAILPPVKGQPDPADAKLNHVFAGGYGRSNRDEIIASSYSAEQPISDAFKLYSFTTYTYRNIKDARGAFIPAPFGYDGLPNASAPSALPQLYPDGFQAYRRIWENDFQATLGLKGDVAG